MLPSTVTPVAELRVELRRLPSTAASPDPTGPLAVDRCVRAALRALAAKGTGLQVSGTERHPVIGASFVGPGSRAQAAVTAQIAARAVRRASGGTLILAGGVAEGWRGTTIDGTAAVLGDPVQVAEHLVERAAPGQVLLGGDGWTAMERISTRPASGDVSDPVAVYVLRDVR